MNATYAVRELVESRRSGWVARGLAGPTSDMLKVMADDFGWQFHQVALDGVTGYAELMDALATQLELPEYFGRNWDALDECLNDLAAGRGVLIRLKAFKTVPTSLLRTLLDVLNDHVNDGSRPFVVVIDPPLPAFT